MAKIKKTNLIPILIGVILVALVIYLILAPKKPSQLGSFAQCLGQKGAAMYGAYWCSHCQDQKSLFGSSAKYMPYVECSTPDGNGQLAVCAAKNITGYPTWVFGDGTRLSGKLSLKILSEKTGCALPE